MGNNDQFFVVSNPYQYYMNDLLSSYFYIYVDGTNIKCTGKFSTSVPTKKRCPAKLHNRPSFPVIHNPSKLKRGIYTTRVKHKTNCNKKKYLLKIIL